MDAFSLTLSQMRRSLTLVMFDVRIEVASAASRNVATSEPRQQRGGPLQRMRQVRRRLLDQTTSIERLVLFPCQRCAASRGAQACQHPERARFAGATYAAAIARLVHRWLVGSGRVKSDHLVHRAIIRESAAADERKRPLFG